MLFGVSLLALVGGGLGERRLGRERRSGAGWLRGPRVSRARASRLRRPRVSRGRAGRLGRERRPRTGGLRGPRVSRARASGLGREGRGVRLLLTVDLVASVEGRRGARGLRGKARRLRRERVRAARHARPGRTGTARACGPREARPGRDSGRERASRARGVGARRRSNDNSCLALRDGDRGGLLEGRGRGQERNEDASHVDAWRGEILALDGALCCCQEAWREGNGRLDG